MNITMKELIKIAEEVTKTSGLGYQTIVFQDGSLSKVTGPWESNKPVWCVFSGYVALDEAIEALVMAYEDDDGLLCFPPGYREWAKKNPEQDISIRLGPDPAP